MPPAAAPMLVAVLPFAYTTEAQLPDGVGIWESDGHHDLVGSGTEILLLLVVVVASSWQIIRYVAVRPR